MPIGFDHPDLRELHRALGRALTEWQFLETSLYIIAHVLMGTSYRASSVAFFHLKSAENKLALVDKLIFHQLSQRVRTKRWSPLKNEVRGIIKFRNALAHFETIWLDEELKRDHLHTRYQVAISSHHLDAHAGRSGMVDALTIEGIEHNSGEAKALVYKLLDFAVRDLPDLDKHTASLPPNTKRWLESFRPSAQES